MIPISVETIPAELRERRQWVCWKYETRSGQAKPTKVPKTIRGGNADSTNPSTWTSFGEALDAATNGDFDGIGFVFSTEDPYVGIDLDDCIGIDGQLAPEAQAIIEMCDTYSEISPSGRGVKLILRGQLPTDATGRKTIKVDGFGAIEAYQRRRYFTITGRRVEGSPSTIGTNPEGLANLYQRYFGSNNGQAKAERREPDRSRITDNDHELLAKARTADNGGKFSALYDAGDTSAHNGDDSAADLALCNMLCFWTGGDVTRMDGLFRGSALMRDKWNERRGDSTYGGRTINEAIRTTTEHYEPRRGMGNGSAARAEVKSDGQAAPDKPIVVCSNRELCDKSRDALEALRQANDPPTLFSRNGGFVYMSYDDERRPIIRSFKVDGFRRRLSEAARFVNVVKGKDDGEYAYKNMSPPIDVTRDLFERGDDGFPLLVNITEVPTLRPDGSLLDTPGWDKSTGLLYVPANGTRASIQDEPNQVAAMRAARLIVDELLPDFPFVDDASRANMLGTFITPLVRPMIAGRTPMAIIDAPQAGTGKTMLTDLVSVLGRGRSGGVMSAPTTNEEWKKTISAALDAGRTILVFDNIAGLLRSSELDAAITAPSWEGRVLGTNTMASCNVSVTWIATGNNVQLGGDLPRRCYWIKLDAGTHRPETRADFKHKDLVEWAKAERAGLVNAMLTMARAWIVAGRPKGDAPRLGSFERWCEIIGGILTFAGVGDFLENWEAERESADTEGPQWCTFLEVLYDAFSGYAFSVGEIESQIRTDKPGDDPIRPELRDALPDFLEGALAKRSFTRSLGWKFRAIRGRRFNADGIRIEVDSEDRLGKRWRVLK